MTNTAMDPSAAPAGEGRSFGPVGDNDASMRAWAEELVARARSEGVELTGDDGLLTALVRRVLQTGLEVEMTEHLGYEPHAPRAGVRQQPQRLLSQDGPTDIGKVAL